MCAPLKNADGLSSFSRNQCVGAAAFRRWRAASPSQRRAWHVRAIPFGEVARCFCTVENRNRCQPHLTFGGHCLPADLGGDAGVAMRGGGGGAAMRGGAAGAAIRGGGAAIRAGGCGAAARGGAPGAAMRGGAACSSLGMTADFGAGGGDGGTDFDDPFVSLPGDCAADDGRARWV